MAWPSLSPPISVAIAEIEPETEIGEYRVAPHPRTLAHTRVRSRRQKNHDSTTITRKPTSPETNLVLALTHTLDRFKLSPSWLSLVPSQIGNNRAIDLAIKAMIRAQQCTISKDATTQHEFLRTYTAAISSFQTSLIHASLHNLNDAVLVAALLYYCEITVDPKSTSSSHHNQGITAILLSGHEVLYTPNELARSILYFHWKGTFEMPVALGKPSPFDSAFWLRLEPVKADTRCQAVTKLRKIGQQLFVRLPRLIAMVRKLRNDSTLSMSVLEARNLGIELSELKDAEAETSLLHRVNVTKTRDLEDAAITPYSFQYSDLNDFEALMYYWQTRMLLNRLCMKLQTLFPNVDLNFDTPLLKEENVRQAVNILMTWEFAYSQRLGPWTLCVGMLALWGAALDVTEFRRGTEILPQSTLRPWILERFIKIHQGVQFTEDDLDVAADLMNGGPLAGIFVAAYNRQR